METLRNTTNLNESSSQEIYRLMFRNAECGHLVMNNSFQAANEAVFDLLFTTEEDLVNYIRMVETFATQTIQLTSTELIASTCNFTTSRRLQ